MDEIMRGLQSYPAQVPLVRFGALSVWMVLVALPEWRRLDKGPDKETGI